MNRLKGCKSKPSELKKTVGIPQLEQLDQLEQTNKVRDKVTLEQQRFESGDRTREINRGSHERTRNKYRKVSNHEPLKMKDNSLEESENLEELLRESQHLTESENKNWLRSRKGKTCEQVIQELIGQKLTSDNESDVDISLNESIGVEQGRVIIEGQEETEVRDHVVTQDDVITQNDTRELMRLVTQLIMKPG